MDPDDQCSLPSLVRLDLRHNNLRHLTPGLRLPKLKELLLADNSLTTANDDDDSTTTTDYSFLQHCENIVTLDVGSNQWTEIPTIIFDLTQLQRLDIGGNQLRGLSSDLGLLPNLITLTWQGNPFRSVPRNISMTELIESLRAAKVSQQETAPSATETTTTTERDSSSSPSDPASSSLTSNEQQRQLSEPVAITTRVLDFSGQKLSDFPDSLVSSHSGVQTLRLCKFNVDNLLQLLMLFFVNNRQ
jgi:Leucine-rich repeat (LRR) protein